MLHKSVLAAAGFVARSLQAQTCQRELCILTSPYLQPDRDIGTWSTIIDITAIMSIIFNCALIAFTSNALFYYFPAMNEHEYDRSLDISRD